MAVGGFKQTLVLNIQRTMSEGTRSPLETRKGKETTIS